MSDFPNCRAVALMIGLGVSAVATLGWAAEPTPEVPADQQADSGPISQGPGLGRGRGRGPMGSFRPDMMTIHAMFDSRDKIQRSVKLLPDGAEAVTESDDKRVANLLQEHVPAMDARVVDNEPLPPMTFHPVFVNLIKNADKYSLNYETTEKGIKVTYKAEDPFVIMLVQEHAQLVSRFLKNGMSEIHKPYELPEVKPQESQGSESR
ncbi:MAG: hypothetical protein KDA80_06290 [Planctomycetaceae bacterium]|nr:hypothetical protein [Planctomycetaceae bacterium]